MFKDINIVYDEMNIEMFIIKENELIMGKVIIYG